MSRSYDGRLQFCMKDIKTPDPNSLSHLAEVHTLTLSSRYHVVVATMRRIPLSRGLNLSHRVLLILLSGRIWLREVSNIFSFRFAKSYFVAQ
jgi:hypothetical protein